MNVVNIIIKAGREIRIGYKLCALWGIKTFLFPVLVFHFEWSLSIYLSVHKGLLYKLPQ